MHIKINTKNRTKYKKYICYNIYMLSTDRKNLIIKYHNDGMSNKEISILVKLGVNAVSKIVNAFYKNNNNENDNKSIKLKTGRKEKTPDEVKKNILKIIDEHSEYKINDVKNKILNNNNISLSKSTIFRILKSYDCKYGNAIIKPFLTDEHKNVRLLWAQNNVNGN